jgi:hypothetical protein
VADRFMRRREDMVSFVPNEDKFKRTMTPTETFVPKEEGKHLRQMETIEEFVPNEMGEELESNVSPEEQQQYEGFVHAGMDLIYSGEQAKVMPEILEALKPASEPATEKGSPPVLALANTAVQVVQRVDTAGFEAEAPVADDVLYHAAQEIIEQLAEVAEAAGIHEYTEEELSGALFQAVDLYRPIAIELGRTTEETLKGQFAEIDQADKAGKLGEMFGMEAPGGAAQPVE